jgi:hypothetical protein
MSERASVSLPSSCSGDMYLLSIASNEASYILSPINYTAQQTNQGELDV